MTKLSTLKQCRRGNHLKSYAFLNFFLSASTNNRSVLGVFFFFYSRLRQFCHWLLKFLQKSQPSPKKINHRQQMYDSSKHSCHSIARPRSSSKLAGVPTQMFIVLHAGYKKKIFLCHKTVRQEENKGYLLLSQQPP